ncbi:carbohydrate kinase family protein [Robbsia sp. KACC 23696]|uniref:carbohydrate kinase family protein n=1 Tax=Robbsia sp. KACC 23696 TaxID=3149231 RepID=UPI00325B4FD4
MASLICGSLAYDNIMTFEGRFGEHILPDQVHILNVSFLVPTMRQEFGGCAGNIAYSLRMLGGDARIMATIGGVDGQRYLDRLSDLDLQAHHVRVIDGASTAQAMITTDLDNNQITAFHPGAMMESHRNDAGEACQASDGAIKVGIVAPDGLDGMIAHCEQFSKAGVPFIFDPGQGLPLFQQDTLRRMIDLSTYLALNDYEAKLVENKTGWSWDEIVARTQATIVTRGEKGATIYHDGQQDDIPVVPAERIVDPTGCGDAFRGGLLYGIENGLDWPTTGRLASLMGSLKIATQGPQNYAYSVDELHAAFQRVFGYALA